MIRFNIETRGFKLTERLKKRRLIQQIIEDHQHKAGEINFIFLSDDELLKLNKEYLNHDTYTDIITFNNTDDEDIIEADIFISADRVSENAADFKVSLEDEIVRVMSHGILHLLGYNDHTTEEQKLMRAAEEKAIKMYAGM